MSAEVEGNFKDARARTLVDWALQARMQPTCQAGQRGSEKQSNNMSVVLVTQWISSNQHHGRMSCSRHAFVVRELPA